jgi:hypothetical protein
LARNRPKKFQPDLNEFQKMTKGLKTPKNKGAKSSVSPTDYDPRKVIDTQFMQYSINRQQLNSECRKDSWR